MMNMYDILGLDIKYVCLSPGELADFLLENECYHRLISGCHSREEVVEKINHQGLKTEFLPKISTRDVGLRKYIKTPVKDMLVLEQIPACEVHPASKILRLVVKTSLSSEE